MQTTKTRGWTNREHGESTRSGCQPTGKGDPAPPYSASLGTGTQSSGQRPGSREPPRRVSLTCPPTGGRKSPGVSCCGAGFRTERLGVWRKPPPTLSGSVHQGERGRLPTACQGKQSAEGRTGSTRGWEASEAPEYSEHGKAVYMGQGARESAGSSTHEPQ